MLDDEGKAGFLTRRGFIKAVGVAAASAGLSACLTEWEALGFKPAEKHTTSFITPNEDFYLVAVDPSFRPSFDRSNVEAAWELTVEGPGGRTASFSYADLLERSGKEFTYTFECIGNSVGGELIGNAQWEGLSLRKLLEESGLLSSSIRSVSFVGLDDFYSGISIERVLDDYSFLATHMNGEPLPPAHGFPVRTVLPNLYGMKQPRWLRRIVLQEAAETTSYWEKRGWAGEIPVKTMSRLDRPGEIRASGKATLSGIAFAGSRGIQGVEVSLDGGRSWVPCTLQRGGDPNQWATWRYVWPRPAEGTHELMVRATDGDGELQTSEFSRRFPDGVTGYDRKKVRVSGAT